MDAEEVTAHICPVRSWQDYRTGTSPLCSRGTRCRERFRPCRFHRICGNAGSRSMGTMDRNTLRWLLQKMEKEAQAALARDGSFLEALQALKWEVDNDFRVRAEMRPLR